MHVHGKHNFELQDRAHCVDALCMHTCVDDAQQYKAWAMHGLNLTVLELQLHQS